MSTVALHIYPSALRAFMVAREASGGEIPSPDDPVRHIGAGVQPMLGLRAHIIYVHEWEAFSERQKEWFEKAAISRLVDPSPAGVVYL